MMILSLGGFVGTLWPSLLTRRVVLTYFPISSPLRFFVCCVVVVVPPLLPPDIDGDLDLDLDVDVVMVCACVCVSFLGSGSYGHR